jgi:hypothetical protein
MTNVLHCLDPERTGKRCPSRVRWPSSADMRWAEWQVSFVPGTGMALHSMRLSPKKTHGNLFAFSASNPSVVQCYRTERSHYARTSTTNCSCRDQRCRTGPACPRARCPPNISDVALILAAHTPMTEKSKVPSKIAGRFGVSSGEKVPIKVVAIYVFI